MQNPDALVKFAVHEIITKINSGSTPQEAAEKVASELQLNHHFIKRAAEAMNVALHHNHFKKHPEKRAEDFATIDAQKVVESMYTGPEKTASEFRSELFSSFQSPEVSPKFARYLEAGPHRAMFEKLANETAVTKHSMSERGVYEKSANYIRDLKKTAENKKAEAIEAEYQITKGFCDILKKFAYDALYRSSWDEFESQVFSKHGEDASEYLDLLYKAANISEPRGKHDKNYTMFNQCKEAELFDRFFSNVEAARVVKQASAEADEALKSADDYIKEAFAIRGCELLNIEKAAVDGTLLEQLERSLTAERQKIASLPEEDPVMNAIKTKKAEQLNKEAELAKAAIDYLDTAASAIGGDLTSNKGQPSLSAMTNKPEHNRERAFLLQELATTDPILSKMPTHKVVNAYEQLLRIAPEISSEKELTRAYLRHAATTQAVDPHQGQQLIEANTKLLKQHQLQQGQRPMSDDKV